MIDSFSLSFILLMSISSSGNYKLSLRKHTEILEIFTNYGVCKEFLSKYQRFCKIVSIYDYPKNVATLSDVKTFLYILGEISVSLKEKLTYYVPNYANSFNRAEYTSFNIQTPLFKLDENGIHMLTKKETRIFRQLLLVTDDFHDLYNNVQSTITPLLIQEKLDKERKKQILRQYSRRNFYNEWFI
jgi:hypothetical protein